MPVCHFERSEKSLPKGPPPNPTDKDSKIWSFPYFLRTILYPIAAIKIDISGEIRLKKQ